MVDSVTGWPEPPLKGLQVYFTSRLERRAWWRAASVSDVAPDSVDRVHRGDTHMPVMQTNALLKRGPYIQNRNGRDGTDFGL